MCRRWSFSKKQCYIYMSFYAALQMYQLTCLIRTVNRRDGVVVGASASQSVDLGFISLVESYQKTLKNGIHSFPAGRSANKG